MKPRKPRARVAWSPSALLVACSFAVASAVAPTAAAQCPESSVPMAGALQAGSEFGTSVALAGDVAVIGAPGWSPPGGAPEGAVIVSIWSGSAWVSDMLARPASVGPGDRFGQSVAINEDATVIAVGAPFHDGAAPDGGLVVVYEWDPALGDWLPTLQVAGIYGSGLFGSSVTASGERVAAGEPGGVFALGSVSVTRRTAPGTWIADGYLVGSQAFALFGAAVALDGELLAVGSPLFDSLVMDIGVVDVLQWQGGAWTLRDRLDETVGSAGSFFGWSVDLDDELLVIGAPGATAGFPGGYASVLAWDGSAYSWLLSHWNLSANSRLGQSVAVSADRTVMGAPGLDEGLGAEAGRASVFQRNPFGNWNLDGEYLISGAPEPGAQFGFSNALGGRRLLVGKPFSDPNGQISAGRVYAYDLESPIVHSDLGQGLAGQQGLVPVLEGVGGMCGTGEEWLKLVDARPNAPVWLVVGVIAQPLPFKGGVLVPRPDVLLSWILGPTGTTGSWFQIPPGLPAFSIWYQYWIKDADGPVGFAASNGLRGDYPAY